MDELVDREPSLPDDRSQRAPVELTVIGNNHLHEWVCASQHDVAVDLTTDHEPGPLERSHTLSPREPRKGTHTATRMASNRSSGTGRLSSFSTST